MAPPTLITEIPHHISPEEHKTFVASTPASFSDIPPVLQHKQENVSASFDPSLEGFTPEDGSSGTLYVLESVLIFMSSTGRGFQVDYPSITLHAISRAESGPSIYCQLDEGATNQDEAEQNDDEDSPMRELILIPQDSVALEPIFEALSHCASLHPDPADADDMDDDNDAFIDTNGLETFDGDEDQELSEVGRAALAHLESIIYNPFEKSTTPATTTESEENEEGQPDNSKDEEEQPHNGANGTTTTSKQTE
ncbi:hypothetical protein NLI96_g13181 [Meripilus lineatus]|uniref:Methylosome subunit pICln n=1 Tax=Meripilus lineatus TaxID=2056292 RepID=A0AAD5UNH3_9APHY|nr:hypothetical protein NLI96_g13181 [Physisporinus lineatus]